MITSRTEKTFLNATVAISCQIATLIINFVTRTIFIKILGSGYLGIGGLFSNILSVLSLAELGFGSAIAYYLFKPIADDDKEKITAVINYYRRVYLTIAGLVFVVGLSLLPFLKYLISSEIDIPNVKFYYVLYLLSSVSSYLFVYKGAVLVADQKQYWVKIYETVVSLITSVGKLTVLAITHNFKLYLVIEICGTLLKGIAVTQKANREYPFLSNRKAEIDKESKSKIFSDVKSLFLYKIGSVILNYTDNILISIIVSTTVVGYYSNYTLLFGMILTFSELIFGALGASVGNQNVSNDKENFYKTFKSINFANFWVYGFCSVCLFSLMDDFVYIWLGEEYVLGTAVSFIISFNVFVRGMMSTVSTYRQATGIFSKTKYVYFATALINLALSIVMGRAMGLGGIILATAISRLLTNVWYEPYILVKKYMNESFAKYMLQLLEYYLLFIIPALLIWLLKSKINMEINFVVFALELIICVLATNMIYFVWFRKRTEFSDLKSRIFLVMKKFIKKKR